MISIGNKWRDIVYRLIDAISFSSQIRELTELLNDKAEHIEKDSSDLSSHPGGFIRAFYKRRISIAASYIRMSRQLYLKDYQQRLRALKTLVGLSFHAKTVSMPMNTARVQIGIMKEAVKNLDNRRKQMEMIADFSLASYGHEAVIRTFLRELRRVEVPENGKPLKELNLGWDSHVHDNLSEGRKTPSQLVLDAFIKGLSTLTLAYYDISDKNLMLEAIEAGKILGIDVRIGIEFSTGPKCCRKHFMYLPPDSFFDEFDFYYQQLSVFAAGLEENRRRRQETITAILESFNNTYRRQLNEGYKEDGIFALHPLEMDDLQKLVQHGQYSRVHLNELLYVKFRETLKHRVLVLRVQHEVFKQLCVAGRCSRWESEQIEHVYQSARNQYTFLSPDELGTVYFSGKNIIDYDSAFIAEDDILPRLKAVGGEIVLDHPLEGGLESAIKTLIYSNSCIDRIELINMRDYGMQNPSEVNRLSDFIDLINNRSYDELQRFLSNLNIRDIEGDVIREAFDHYHEKPLIPTAGSASTGWKPNIPGMGFIRVSDVPQKSRKDFIKNHYQLPKTASILITTQGKGLRHENYAGAVHEIYSLGKSGRFKPNLVGDEHRFTRIGFKRLWRYLNPVLKNSVRTIIGMIPACLQIGTGYTVIWFGMTFIRNVLADLFSASGTRIKAWSSKDVNFDNVSQSLFWTGFSVPILASVKVGFDYCYPFQIDTPFKHEVFVWLKFFTICIANGSYIAMHNTLRNFDRKVIWGNFFRSMLAWPFASVFEPIGNLLMVPSIVQAKFWSELVAAFIEGIGKLRQRIILRRRDYSEILPILHSEKKEERLTAMMDILYIWAKRQSGRTCLAQILDQTQKSSDYLDLMIELFKPENAHYELSMFVVEKYLSNETIVLTDLINTSLVSFDIWLRKLKKKELRFKKHQTQS